jgi:hypothetical protein
MMAETTRSKWRHQNGDRYVPVFGHWYGNPQDGYHHEWSLLGGYHGTLAEAKKAGLAAQGSDDFNIAVVRGHRVVAALLWKDEDIAEEAYVLRKVEEALWSDGKRKMNEGE